MYVFSKIYCSLTKNEAEDILIPMYYSPSASGFIILTSNIFSLSSNTFNKFILESNLETEKLTMSFTSNTTSLCTINKCCRNELWYFSDPIFYPMNTNQPHINAAKLNSQQQSELWSLRMGSAGESNLRMIHKHVTGVSP